MRMICNTIYTCGMNAIIVSFFSTTYIDIYDDFDHELLYYFWPASYSSIFQ